MNPFAIYFPQFYPISTNDKAWGKGFTDWTLVANANMRDWWSRRAPERGFYDGSVTKVHALQMAEARQAGIGGFAVYHYWFYTHHELDAFERTLMREPREAGLPWFLVWASEGWSRRWMGDATELVHLPASPSTAQIRHHCEYLAACFEHPNYVRVNGLPLFAWYNVGHFSDPARVLGEYRRTWTALGIDVHVAQFVKRPFDVRFSPLVDSNYLFEPRLYFAMQGQGGSIVAKRILDGLNRIGGERWTSRLLVAADRVAPRGKTYESAKFVQYLSSSRRQELITSLGSEAQDVLTPGWNNTPRYGRKFTALEDLPPDVFASLIAERRGAAKGLPLLINAWNEWSEGAAIEPCAYLGRRYLDAIRSTPAPLEPSPVQAVRHSLSVSP